MITGYVFTKKKENRKMRTYIFSLVCILAGLMILVSCADSERRLVHHTLDQAGAHKSELVRALSYYDQEKDSLKRKAMLFLIEHMYAHHSYHNDQMDLINRAFSVVDTILTRQTNTGMSRYVDFSLFSSVIDSISREKGRTRKGELEIQWDSQTVTANFLIQNVEFAYRAWKTNPWARNIDFNTFCEYVLPYRLENEHIESWRPQFYNEYSRKAGKFRNITDVKSASRLATSLRTQRSIESVYPYSMDISAVNLLRMGRCYDIGRYRVMVLRSVGIPATLDYVPHWGNYSGEHGVVRIVTLNQQRLLENSNTTENISTLFESSSFLQGKKLGIADKDLPQGVEVQYSKTIPKVYRHTWSVQPDRKQILDTAEKDELIPNYRICIKDVTNEYVTCSDVRISMDEPKHRVGYLCVSERGEWIPVITSAIDANGQILFRDMGKNIMYLPTVYENKRMRPAGKPFYLDDKGEVHQVCAHSSDKQSVRLLAKYTYFSYTAIHATSLKGGYFEGSNREDFVGADSLGSINGIPYYIYKLPINTSKRYRYVRFTSLQEKNSCLAELSFYGLDSNRDTVLLSPTRFHDGVKYHWLDVLRDKKYGKYYPMYTNHLTADLGSPQQLTNIEIVPRSNTNGIIPGKQYELFYWDENNGWTSLGKQEAESWSLCYDEVPVGALLWLKCYDGGKEERIFTYENGVQKWW